MTCQIKFVLSDSNGRSLIGCQDPFESGQTRVYLDQGQKGIHADEDILYHVSKSGDVSEQSVSSKDTHIPAINNYINKREQADDTESIFNSVSFDSLHCWKERETFDSSSLSFFNNIDKPEIRFDHRFPSLFKESQCQNLRLKDYHYQLEAWRTWSPSSMPIAVSAVLKYMGYDNNPDLFDIILRRSDGVKEVLLDRTHVNLDRDRRPKLLDPEIRLSMHDE